MPALVYHWADSFLGGWIRTVPNRWRAVLVVQERGWWDAAIDPRRYRLTVGERAVLRLGGLLPRPDLVVIAEAPVGEIVRRSGELDASEVARQRDSWHRIAAGLGRTVVVDTSRGVAAAAADATAAVHDRLAVRATRDLGYGWAALGTSGERRWWVPRGPRRVSLTGIGILTPTSSRARTLGRAAKAFARVGGLGLLRRAELPEGLVAELADALRPGETFSLARANHPERFNALLLPPRGGPRAFVKIGLSDKARDELAREADALERLGPHLPAPLGAPRLLQRLDSGIVLEHVQGEGPDAPTVLPVEVAEAIGGFFASTGAIHGDLAPWNLIRQNGRWTLLDWERAALGGRAFHDLWHYIVQCHALLGAPDPALIVQGLQGRGWIADRIERFASAAKVSTDEARPALLAYLNESRAELDPSKSDGLKGLEARDRLVAELERCA
jgi:hypothetical protein